MKNIGYEALKLGKHKPKECQIEAPTLSEFYRYIITLPKSRDDKNQIYEI